MAKMTADEVISLKSAIKTEMARRNGYGSLSTDSGYGYAAGPDASQTNYADASYDFITTPTNGGIIKAEHG